MYYVDVPLFILTTGSEPVKVAINQEKSEIIAGYEPCDDIAGNDRKIKGIF